MAVRQSYMGEPDAGDMFKSFRERTQSIALRSIAGGSFLKPEIKTEDQSIQASTNSTDS